MLSFKNYNFFFDQKPIWKIFFLFKGNENDKIRKGAFE